MTNQHQIDALERLYTAGLHILLDQDIVMVLNKINYMKSHPEDRLTKNEMTVSNKLYMRCLTIKATIPEKK